MHFFIEYSIKMAKVSNKSVHLCILNNEVKEIAWIQQREKKITGKTTQNWNFVLAFDIPVKISFLTCRHLKNLRFKEFLIKNGILLYKITNQTIHFGPVSELNRLLDYC